MKTTFYQERNQKIYGTYKLVIQCKLDLKNKLLKNTDTKNTVKEHTK